MGALQTSIPAATAKPIMMLPTCNIKACAKYQFLEEINKQYRSLSVQKSGAAGLYVLHVSRNSTRSSLEDFSQSSLLKK